MKKINFIPFKSIKLLSILAAMIFCVGTTLHAQDEIGLDGPNFTLKSLNDLETKKSLHDELRLSYQVNDHKRVVFVKFADEETPVLMDGFLDRFDIEKTYDILVDPYGNILRIEENWVYNDKGDWSYQQIHYFDLSGKTFGYERKVTYEKEGCADGMISESTIEYYTTLSQLLFGDSDVRDSKFNDLDEKECGFNVRTNEQSIITSAEYLKVQLLDKNAIMKAE